MPTICSKICAGKTVVAIAASMLICFCNPILAYAIDEIQVKVVAQVEYSEETKTEDERQLFLKFKQTAIKKSMNNMPDAKFKLMKQYFEDITDPEIVDDFISRVRVPGSCEVATGKNCGNVKGNSMEIRGMAYVNVTAIDQFLASRTTDLPNEISDNEFAFLLIARKVYSEKIFDAKRTQIFEESENSEKEVIEGGDETSIIQGQDSSTINVLKEGGNTEFKLEEYDYKVDMAATDKLGSAVFESLVNAGFEPLFTDDYVEDYDIPYLDELVENGNFGEDGTLDRRTLNAIKKATNEDGIKFLGVGKIDYRLPEENALTENMRIPAIITVNVFMAKGRRMRAVASVSPQLVFGEYEKNGDRTIGETRAQNNAVSLAMDTIVSQLQSKGLR